MYRYLIIIILIFSSCRKLIEVPVPGDEVDIAQVLSNDRNAEQLIFGLYDQIMNDPESLLNGGTTLYSALSADEISRSNASANEDAFFHDALTSQNPLCSNLYKVAYNQLFQCNSIIERVSGAGNLSDSMRNHLCGEVRLVRALLYFQLVNLFGDLPLATTTDFTVNTNLSRTSTTLIYRQIIDDLLKARQQLPDTYIARPSYEDERIRPNKAVATALLARVYLYLGEWSLASSEADALIGDAAYSLETDLDKVFLASSREAIWELQPVYKDAYTAEAGLFLPNDGFARPTYALTNWLLNSFEAGDLRLSHWTARFNGAIAYVYPYKYKAANRAAPIVEYNTVFRLAEQYLIRAESRAHLDDTAGAAADLNVIRHRAGLSPTKASDTISLLTAIHQERRVELFAEWGHRWLDLKRTGRVDSVLKMEKPGWKTTAALYPIPYTDMVNDPNLVQNPGY